MDKIPTMALENDTYLLDLNYDRIPGYPDGSDITVINTYYCRAKKNPETGKYGEDSLTIIFRDNKTGQKKHHTFMSPKYTFYIVKEEYQVDYNLFYIDDDKVVPFVCKYRDREMEMAKLLGKLDDYYSNMRTGNARANNDIHIHPAFVNSDMNIEDYYRLKFSQRYTNEIFKIKKGFADIEADIRYTLKEFPDLGEVPINATSYFDKDTNTVYTYLLRDKNNPLIEEFERNLGPWFFERIRALLREKINNVKKLKKYKLHETKFQLFFFDSEIEMLATIFKTIHTLSPDILLFWNAAFDTRYIIERIRTLGYNPEEILCEKQFQVPVAYYIYDEKNDSKFAERGDFSKIAWNTVLLCQMINFASRRKGQSAIPDFKLNTIGEFISDIGKLDYSAATENLRDLPYIDYALFVLYNIFDVIVQYCIEEDTSDAEFIFSKCLINNTRYEKGYRQTVYLVNRFTKEFKNMNLIIGNNVNKKNHLDEKFVGAIVGDPTFNNDYSKLKINGNAINIADNLMDEDYKSLYPNTELENNIAADRLIARIRVPEKAWDDENRFKAEKWTRDSEMMDLFITGRPNMKEFCHRYMHLASFEELLEDIQEYYEKKYEVHLDVQQSENGTYLLNPFQFTNQKTIECINFDYTKQTVPFIMHDKVPDDIADGFINQLRGELLWK